jgi:hypothetical protein
VVPNPNGGSGQINEERSREGITAGQAATAIEMPGCSVKCRAAVSFPDYANKYPDDTI